MNKYKYFLEKNGHWLKAGATKVKRELTSNPLDAECFDDIALAKLFKAIFNYDDYIVTEHEFILTEPLNK